VGCMAAPASGYPLVHDTQHNPPCIHASSDLIYDGPSSTKTMGVVLIILLVQIAVMAPNISIYSNNPHSDSCSTVNEFLTGFIIFHGCWILWALWAPATMMHGLFGVYQGLCFAFCLWLGMFTWANVGIARLMSSPGCQSEQSSLFSVAILDIVFTYVGSMLGCLLFCWRFGLVRAFRKNRSNMLSQVANLDADTLVDPMVRQQKQEDAQMLREEHTQQQEVVNKGEDSGFTFSSPGT